MDSETLIYLTSSFATKFNKLIKTFIEYKKELSKTLSNNTSNIMDNKDYEKLTNELFKIISDYKELREELQPFQNYVASCAQFFASMEKALLKMGNSLKIETIYELLPKDTDKSPTQLEIEVLAEIIDEDDEPVTQADVKNIVELLNKSYI